MTCFAVRRASPSPTSFFLLTFMTGIVVMTASAHAQTVTGPSDAGRVQERVPDSLKLSPAAPALDIKAAPLTAAPAGAEKITFTLTRVTFDGMSAYTPDDVQHLYQPMLGKTITLTDVYDLAARLTAYYRNDGYILTQIVVPPQTIQDGVVRLQVVEGFIDTITIEGSANDYERALIESYAGYARAGSALNIANLEQALLLINDLPGLSARSIISPAPAKVGAADLRIIATHDPFEGMVALDNYGSPYLGQVQGSAAFSLNSLLGFNEQMGAQLIYAPEGDLSKELAYGALTYNQPIGPWGTRLDLMTSLASTRPGHTLEEFDIDGRAFYWHAKVNHPVIRTRQLNWSIYGQLDSRNVDTQSNIEATRHDKIRSVRIGTDFSMIDRLGGAGYNTLNIELARGLDILGASDAGDANLSRTMGDPQFTKLEIEYQRLQRLGSRINMLVGVKGQMASDALLSSEEFGVGGADYGRGYDPSEIVGDDGIAGKIEIQWNNPRAWSLVDTYQVYGFVDGGRVWNSDATTSADRQISLSSTGVGLRATFPAQTQAGLFVAVPLSRDVESMGDQDARLYFNLAQPF